MFVFCKRGAIWLSYKVSTFSSLIEFFQVFCHYFKPALVPYFKMFELPGSLALSTSVGNVNDCSE